MTTPPASRRLAFTLVEILVVIAIITMLIAIAVPSLIQAKDAARKAKTRTELATISTNLEVFQTDYRYYPESNATRLDPIVGLPTVGDPDNPKMQGAHWLARALAGPDGEGLDLQTLVLKDRPYVDVDTSTGQLKAVDGNGTGGTLAALQKTPRKGRYLGNTRLLALDGDPATFATPFAPNSGGAMKGRFILADGFNGPILYYRAAPRATAPFTIDESATGPCAGPAVYNLQDNALITGCDAPGLSPAISGWDFGNTTLRHGLGFFGPDRAQMLANPDSVHTMVPPISDGYRGQSFCDFLHDHQARETGRIIKPINAETYVLISAGKDALFGTADDITNFDPR